MFGQNDRTIRDNQLGEILFRKNDRARKYIIRIKHNTVSVTIPYMGTYKEAEKFFLQNRSLVLQKTEALKAERERQNRQEVPACNETALRRQAQAVLPGELERLAKMHGFHYQGVRIRKCKTRWGSCSSKGNISLSFYLMLLPHHLQEYVLLHELCHTVQMNHGPAFWAILDKCTQGKAKAYRTELKKQNPLF
jgi:predicted metal-dependent hydrolase